MPIYQNLAVIVAWTGMSWLTSVTLAPDIKDAVSSCIFSIRQNYFLQGPICGAECELREYLLTVFQLMN